MTALRAAEQETRRPKGRPRRVAAVLAVAVGLATASAGAGQDEIKNRCLVAYEQGQRAHRRGAFSEAQEALAFCGGASCPVALHADCQRWLDEVEAAMPTSVFRVYGASGQVLQGVHLSIDGGPAQRLDGRALSLDPGEHALLFELAGYQQHRQVFVFMEGEKLTVREVQLEPLATPSEAAPEEAPALADAAPQTTLFPAWLGVGVGALGVAGFAYFGLSARADDRALDACSPDCSPTRVDDVREQYLLANISLGVGTAGLLGAAAWLLFGGDATDSSETAIASPNLELHVGPMTSFVGSF